jgi:hypothetical protein
VLVFYLLSPDRDVREMRFCFSTVSGVHDVLVLH